MKIILLFIFLAGISFSQSINIEFRLNAPGLSPDTTIFITGSHYELGGWDPGAVPMEYQGDNIWTKKISINKPELIEYKFTLGSWEKEGADSNGFPLKNFNAEVSGDTVIQNTVIKWTSSGQKIVKGQITGTVKYHRNFKGESVSDRDIIVWLPPGYEDSIERYPVLYMHDGQNIVDPFTSSFGVDWQIDESLDSMIRNNEIQPVIVVGIYNTPQRTLEYTPGNKSQEYMDFIIENLKPFIDSEYRTKPEAENTINGGASAGGLISFMLVWEHPDVFGKAICMSPSFKIDNIGYIDAVEEADPPDNVFFYIYNGGIGIDKRLQPGVDEMIITLKNKGYAEGKDFIYISDPESEHFESAWAKRFPAAIKFCLKKNF